MKLRTPKARPGALQKTPPFLQTPAWRLGGALSTSARAQGPAARWEMESPSMAAGTRPEEGKWRKNQHLELLQAGGETLAQLSSALPCSPAFPSPLGWKLRLSLLPVCRCQQGGFLPGEAMKKIPQSENVPGEHP